MKKSMIRLLLLVTLVICTISLIHPVVASGQDDGFSYEERLKRFEEVSKGTILTPETDDEMIEFLVLLKEQVDTGLVATQAKQRIDSGFDDRMARIEIRTDVVEALQLKADTSQKDIIAFLQEEQRNGNIDVYSSYFIVNALFIRGNQDLMDEIALRPDVQEVMLNERVELIRPIAEEELIDGLSIEWNIRQINSDKVWNQYGVDGSGVVVGIIDTGVDWEHEALQRKYRGYGSSSPHRYNWHDPYHSCSYPDDWHGHGTHCAGTVLGADPSKNNQIGVAPGATWIASRGLDDMTGTGSYANLLSSMQWMLAPTPNVDGSGTPNPSRAPDIVNNSWGGSAVCSTIFLTAINNWRNAQILPVFAAGNDGPSSGTVGLPANYGSSFAVGAVDSSNSLAWFSSRGPSACSGVSWKPDISAPGVSIRSARSWTPSRSRGYTLLSGTSMAAPHIAGVAALMRSADPSLTVQELENIMKSTATKLTNSSYTSSPNHGFGYGLVNAYDAVGSLSFVHGVALYSQGNATYYIKNTPYAGVADRTFRYGPRGNSWLPVAGDWTGNGINGVALYDQRSGSFLIKDTPYAGVADRTFRYGPRNNNWIPVAGDWTGNGVYGVALYDQRAGTFYIKDTPYAGFADRTFRYGPSNNNWLPVAGDWTGNDVFGVALYDQQSGTFYIKDTPYAGVADRTFRYGPSNNNWLPVAGSWR